MAAEQVIIPLAPAWASLCLPAPSLKATPSDAPPSACCPTTVSSVVDDSFALCAWRAVWRVVCGVVWCVCAPCSSGVKDGGISNLVLGRGVDGSLSVARLSAAVIASQKLIPVPPSMMQNSWSQYSASNRSQVGFWRDPLGVVHLQGHLTGGQLQKPMFTLPSNCRPNKNKCFAAAGAHAVAAGAVVRVSDQGDVVLDEGSAEWISVDGVSFRAGD
jgi:hypothetical protein